MQALHVRLVWLLLLLVLPVLAAPSLSPKFVIDSDFPQENIWTKRLLERSNALFEKHFSHPLAEIPKTIHVVIQKDPKSKGVGGGASFENNTLHFRSNLWQNDRYRRWILVHELSNLLAARYGSQGYPSDWWSNGRSPFPVYAAWLILGELQYPQDAHWLKKSYQDKKDHQLYWHLDATYTPELFKKFFYLLKRDGVHLERIGKPWPNPDPQRALVSAEYLSLAAGENLAPTLQRYDIGKRPYDWHLRHKKIAFIPYVISEKEVDVFLKKHWP